MATEGWAVFDAAAEDYDDWYDRHAGMYAAEVEAVARALGPSPPGRGLEIGVGSGRFATRLGLGFGVDRSPRMVALARSRGCRAVVADAGRLPFADEAFERVALLTVLCFLPDPAAALQEAWRVTRPGGRLVVAHLDPGSPPGAELAAHRSDSPYYAHASLLSPATLSRMLAETGFIPETSWQVLGKEGAYRVAPGSHRGLYRTVGARRLERP